MQKIALVNARRYFDMGTDMLYTSGKVYEVSEKISIRLLQEKTYQGEYYFGKVVDKKEDKNPVVTSDSVIKNTPKRGRGRPRKSPPQIEESSIPSVNVSDISSAIEEKVEV
jgi:hypothetical protein